MTSNRQFVIIKGVNMAVPRKPNYKTYTRQGIKFDRVELSLKYLLIRRKLEKEIDAELEEYLANNPRGGHWGLCHVYWWIKKDILKEKYNIEWHSPAELNPRVRFD